MKRKILFSFIAVLICLTLSALVEIFIFNYKTIFSPNTSTSISFESTTDKSQKIIQLNTDEIFINKLIIDYDSGDKTPYQLSYSTPDAYGTNVEKTVKDTFDNLLPSSIINIGAKASDLKIQFDKSSNIEITNVFVDNNFHFNILRFFFFFSCFILIYILYIFYKSGFKTEKLHIYFAVACGFLGTMFIVIQPAATFYSFDDQTHFQTILDLFDNGHKYTVGEYNMSEADISHSVGFKSINSIEEQQLQNDYLNTNQTINYSSSASPMLSFNKVAYLPMKFGYEIPKLIGLPFTICFKIAKILNLLVYVLLMAYAIKKTKIGKRLLTLLALLPTNIFLASQFSYDPAVFAGIAIFFVEVLNLIVDKKQKLDFKTLLIIIVSISYACFTKAVYAPLLLLTLLIPNQKFPSKKQALKIKTGLIAITILLLSTFILPVLSGTMASDSRGGDTSVKDQLSLIIMQPLGYTEVLNDTAVNQFSKKLISANTFGDFAYIETPSLNPNSNLYFILIAIFFFVFFTDNALNTLNKKSRLLILLANILVILFIWTALYLSYTPVGSITINGVQDRYFLPLLFPMFIALQLKNIKNNIDPKFYNTIVVSIPTIVMLLAIYSSILIPYAF